MIYLFWVNFKGYVIYFSVSCSLRCIIGVVVHFYWRWFIYVFITDGFSELLIISFVWYFTQSFSDPLWILSHLFNWVTVWLASLYGLLFFLDTYNLSKFASFIGLCFTLLNAFKDYDGSFPSDVYCFYWFYST